MSRITSTIATITCTRPKLGASRATNQAVTKADAESRARAIQPIIPPPLGSCRSAQSAGPRSRAVRAIGVTAAQTAYPAYNKRNLLVIEVTFGGSRSDRKSVVEGKSVSVMVGPGGRRIL